MEKNSDGVINIPDLPEDMILSLLRGQGVNGELNDGTRVALMPKERALYVREEAEEHFDDILKEKGVQASLRDILREALDRWGDNRVSQIQKERNEKRKRVNKRPTE